MSIWDKLSLLKKIVVVTFVRVMSKPRIDVMTMTPTRMKEMCCDQNCTSNSKPKYMTMISNERVITSFLPTRSKMMLIVDFK